MDVIRLVLWGPFILSNVLQIPATLGTFYLVISVFGVIIKLIAMIFALLVRRALLAWARDPHRSSTVGRNPVGWMQFIPTMVGPSPAAGGGGNVVGAAVTPVFARKQGDESPPKATEKTRLLNDDALSNSNSAPSTPTKSMSSKKEHQYESFGNPM